KIFAFGVFKENWALVKQESMYGFIDNEGKEVVPCQYDKKNGKFRFPFLN
ncbi:MAG: WG repeat-containing protein, partial [Bacteroidia bacterium]|nr:WG repeat-containing protein [Bacteroidia bacterium]